MLPSDPSESWVQQWLRRRVSAYVRRCGGDIRQNVGVDLVERRGTGPWTAWGFFGSLQGTKDRLQRCLSADAEVIELVARDRAACDTLGKRASKLSQGKQKFRVRTMAAVVAETAPQS
jgi:hypothetical protein